MPASDTPSRAPQPAPDLCPHCGAPVPPLAVGEASPCGHLRQTDRPHPALARNGLGLPGLVPRGSDRPMWCDRFDADLPKVLPDARAIVGDLGDVVLWTFGHVTDGTLNHPNVWNGASGFLAFFGFGGSARPPGYVGSGTLVRCTAWEAIRDAWPHGYTLHVERQPVWNTLELRPQLETILWDLRGWRAQPAEAEAARAVLRRSLGHAATLLRFLVEQHGPGVERSGAAA